ncbi:baseplate J/gp47 family protein [Methylocapsa acidiphila]|uniref:baseplate J/gp47 family protein n=1 Tax=Methylocapsa acidiphila TaxID=133552 RepID=UPI000409A2E8|nr:baseplate J/gp47 family protein [Methylocapsa acidiphila]
MTIKLPNLDDRSFADLLGEAIALIDERCPQWNDRTPSDPGMTLVEVFAYLTEILIYRVNRMPEKAHFALLDLLGVAPLAPAPAEATVTFSRAQVDRDAAPLTIPAGTLVTDRAGTLTFCTLEDAILPGWAIPERPAPSVDAKALNAEKVVGELIGRGGGEPGQSFLVQRGPILRRPSEPNSLIVGVEVRDGDPPAGAELRSFAGKTFATWREVNALAGYGPSDPVYVVDRAKGMIVFGSSDAASDGARSAGAAPGAGLEIRAWYLRGGGRQGNVAPGTLTVLKTPIRGVEATNRARASGGEDMEPIERALARGREAVRVLRAAVTARDFENVACETPGIARARAYAQRDVWRAFGRPGVVDVLVVPRIDPAVAAQGVDSATLSAHQTSELLANVRDLVRRRRPVGVDARVDWVRCRPVDISARVVLSAIEDRDLVSARLAGRLYKLLAPDGDWPFGRPLRASDVYEAFLAEPGVRYAENLTFHIADAPSSDIKDIHRDQCQETTFYAAGRALYRSLDGGDSWAPILEREGEVFLGVRTAAILPGFVAAFSRRLNGEQTNYVVYVSEDGGESWIDRRGPSDAAPEDRILRRVFGFEIRDVAWTEGLGGAPVLAIAGRAALQQIRFSERVMTEIVAVRGATEEAQRDDQRGFEAVASIRHVSGLRFVAVAARERLGVFVASGVGPFSLLPGTTGKNIRVLAFQQQGNETFLWAGLSADKGEPGKGAMRIGMRVDGSYDPTGWETFDANWSSGSCEALDFWGDFVAAGSNRGGILLWRIGKSQKWSDPPALSCGLPLVDERRSLAPAFGVGVGPGADADRPTILFGGDGGAFRSEDLGRTYKPNGRTDFEDRAPLPLNWLFCSGKIELDVAVESAGETGG